MLMHIIKPYGRSHVENRQPDGTRRIVRLHVQPEKQTDIEEFARSYDRLVIAQWISAIDKIASKPVGNNSPTDEQRAFRQRLGDAAWALLEANKLLPGLSEPKAKEQLK